MRLFIAFIWLVLTLCTPLAVQAQAPPAPAAASRMGQATDAKLDAIEARLRAIRTASRSRTLDDVALQGQLDAIPPLQADLADLLSRLTPRLEDAQARLSELGDPPAAGAPAEASDIAANRARLVRMRQSLDGSVKRTRLLSVEAAQLSETLTGRLQKNFSTRLWAHGPSAFDPALWGSALAASDAQRFAAALAGQLSPSPAARVWMAVLGVLGLVFLGPVRVLLMRLGRRWASTVVPNSGLRRSALAVWLTLSGTLAPLAGALIWRQAFATAGPLPPLMAGLTGALASAIFFAALIESLGRALLSPGKPSWRLAPVSDGVAERLAAYPTAIALAVGLTSFVTQAADVLDASAPVSRALECLVVLVQLGAVGYGLVTLGRARSAHQPPAEHAASARSRLPWVLAAIAAWAAMGAALLAVCAGYLALASFVMRELIWIGLVLASLFLMLRFIDDLCQALFSAQTPLGRMVETAIGVSEEALEQIGVLISGLLRLGLMLFGWMAIVAPFGASAREIFGRATSAEMVFKLGQLSISPGLIFGAAMVFVVGLAVTRLVRGWLETTYLPKTRMDVGLRTSVTAGLTYLGALAAVLMTCAYLGLSLDKIALFASALSVGVGFGLQAVIGNFVSGLILLAERPVKVGDWIAIGDLEGDVRRINIRATEIEMGDRSKLIVPNSDLISKSVRNVTPGGVVGQVKIVLRVSNDADPAQVRDLMSGCLQAHAEVLSQPAPGVYLTAAPEGALELTAVGAVASARHAFKIKSDLMFAMVAAFRAHGVHLAGGSAQNVPNAAH